MLAGVVLTNTFGDHPAMGFLSKNSVARLFKHTFVLEEIDTDLIGTIDWLESKSVSSELPERAST